MIILQQQLTRTLINGMETSVNAWNELVNVQDGPWKPANTHGTSNNGLQTGKIKGDYNKRKRN